MVALDVAGSAFGCPTDEAHRFMLRYFDPPRFLLRSGIECGVVFGTPSLFDTNLTRWDNVILRFLLADLNAVSMPTSTVCPPMSPPWQS